MDGRHPSSLMTSDEAITIARQALERQGFSIAFQADYAQLISAEEINKHCPAAQVAGPRWSIFFPLKKPNELRSHAAISVDDTTGEASEGCTS